MRQVAYLTILMAGLLLATSPIGAKYNRGGVTTSLQNIMVLIDLSHNLDNTSSIYIDGEGCQCVCDTEQWSCIDTLCEMQADACLNEALSYDSLPWQTDAPTT